MSLARRSFLISLCGVMAVIRAEMPPPATGDDGAIPQPLKEEAFDALLTSSPFTRTLGVSDSIILTGIAHFEGDVYATLFDTQTSESHIVSKTANPKGWQLVGVGGKESDVNTWSAKIQIAGGQVVSVRYQTPPKKSSKGKPSSSGSSGGSNGSSGGSAPPLSNAQLDEAKNAAVNYKEGFNADGYPKAPPPEMVAKLSNLSVTQREAINRTMFGFRNQGLGLDERRKIYENLVDRSIQGRR